MSASANDKFMKAGAGTVTTLSAPGKALSATSITVGSTTNYPTDTGIVFAIRQVDVNGELVAGTYTEWAGTVTSGTTLSMDAAPVYGSDQVYPAGSTTQVYIPLSSSAHNKMVDGLLVSHDQDGTLKAGAVDNAGVLAADVVETAKIKDANVTTAKINDGAVTAPKLGLIYAAGNNSSEVLFSTSATYTTVASVSVAPTTTTIFQIDAICQHFLAGNQETQIRIYDSSTSTVLFEVSNVSNPNDLLRTQGVHTQISLTSGTHNIALQIRAYNGSAGTHKVHIRGGSLTIFSIGV